MEIKFVYRRRVPGEQPPSYLIKILSFISGDHEDSKEGFGETESQDQEDDGSSIERIPNVCPNRRAYLHRKCKKKISASSDRNVVCPNFPSRGQPRRVQKIESELRGMLYDDIFDRYFRRIWRHTPEEKRDQYTYLNCLWFCMYNNECFRDRVLTWIKKKNIFSKTYVFVPIVMWSHWCLLIFCHFGESLKSKTRTPCMLLLDSLHALDPMRLEPLIRRLVIDIFETEDRHENIDLIENIPLLVPEVPQQRNGEECGIFVLYYTHLFLESAPQEFSISKGYPYFMKDDWFDEEELEGFYEKLESLDIGSSEDEE